jgi:hypothetical protein
VGKNDETAWGAVFGGCSSSLVQLIYIFTLFYSGVTSHWKYYSTEDLFSLIVLAQQECPAEIPTRGPILRQASALTI